MLISIFAIAFVISLIIQKQRQTRNRLARQQMAHDYEQSLLKTRIEVQDATLAIIGHELHDNINQSLTACAMYLSQAEEAQDMEAARTPISETRQQLKAVIKNIRLLSHSLASSLVEQRPLEEAIQKELNRIAAFSGHHCNLIVHTLVELDEKQRLLLFRIVQEALQNILKHAKATGIVVTIEEEQDKYLLSISDNGCGFDVGLQTGKSSLGITNIRQRVDMLKGQLFMDSSKDNGTTLRIILPLYDK